MPLLKILLPLPKDFVAQRLDQALATLLPAHPQVAKLGLALSKGKIRKLVLAGAVYLGGGRVRIASKIVRPGSRLEVYLDPEKLAGDAPPAREWAFAPEMIVYEDEWIVGVAKPAGLPTQPTVDEARANLYALLGKFLRERDGEAAYVGLHHRLDRDTSGVMIFTKRKEANAEVGKMFAEHTARKTYVALVATGARKLPAAWQVDNFLARRPGKGGPGAGKGPMHAVRSGGDRAITDFRVLDAAPGVALVEAKPRTGRMHQIRVHLAEGGTPIYGDRAYGYVAAADAPKIPRVMLHAVALTFPHPITKLETSFAAPIAASGAASSIAPIVADFQACFRQLFGRELRS